MKVCLIAANDALRDPRGLVMWHFLETAGHDVSFVTAGPGRDPDVVSVRTTPPGVLTRILKRREASPTLSERLSEAAASTGASVYVPTDHRALDAAIAAATATGGTVSRTPKMTPAGDVDLIDIAPNRPEASSPLPGLGRFHTPLDDRAPYSPEPGRHRDRSVVLCYRRSEINPGRYLEAALSRANARLRVETERIDLDTVDPETDVVLFVEGPYPALEVTGSTPAPTLFWAHHGEHHLHANLRLADRYRADAVLLAHSWHLALWFPVPVHRFPFGFDPTLLHPEKPLEARRFDVAMVGAGLTSGGQYGRRQQLVSSLSEAFPQERLGFREQVSAEEMADLYADSRVVINEGGTRHYPITMRVMEAVGSGAVLLSEGLPGMDMLLEVGAEYITLGDDVVGDVKQVLHDLDASQELVNRALKKATGLHTYDHRVDELFSIAAVTPKRAVARKEPASVLARVIDHDVEVQRVAQWGADDLAADLPGREVWDARNVGRSRLAPGKMESVAVREGRIEDLEWLLPAARRYAYLESPPERYRSHVSQTFPQATMSEINGVTRIDFHAPSYRILDFEERPT